MQSHPLRMALSEFGRTAIAACAFTDCPRLRRVSGVPFAVLAGTTALALGLGAPRLAYSQVTTAPATDVQLDAALEGNGATITGLTITAAAGAVQYGTFAGGNSNPGGGPVIGLDTGVIISSGDTTDVPGTNTDATGTGDLDHNLGGTSCTAATSIADLNAIAGQTDPNDCVQIDFDIAVITDQLALSFVFFSEEYWDYVCSGFNDAFAFFVSGPGITGPYQGGTAINLATLGNGTDISINNITDDFGNNCGGSQNPGSYVANYDGGSGDPTAIHASNKADGWTIPVTSSVTVTPNATYHATIIIADYFDARVDSGVFIENFFADPPDLTVTKSSTPSGVVAAGDTITYTVVVSNAGPGAARGIVVNDSLPTGVAYVPESTLVVGPGGLELDNIPGGVRGDLSSGTPPTLVETTDGLELDPGESLTVTFDVTVDDPLDLSVLEITNVAEALAIGLTAPEMGEVTNQTEFGAPVTLASFTSTELGGTPENRSVRFEWTTSTEVGNLGFYLFELGSDGIVKITEELVRSPVIDSVQPQTYSIEAHEVSSDRFVLVDVDTLGGRRLHGPFRLGETTGAPAHQAKRTDWERIREAHRTKRRERRESRRTAPKRLRAIQSRAGDHSTEGFPRAELQVDHNGVQRVTHNQLLAAGIDFTGAPVRSLAVTNRGRPVAIRVHGQGSFGPGSFVEFLGETIDSLYTTTNVYQLTVDPTNARRIPLDQRTASQASQIATSYIESKSVSQNHLYSFASPGDDPWYDRSLLAISGPTSMTISLELEDWVVGDGPVELTLDLWGGTDFPASPDHHVVSRINGIEIADETFDGLEARSISVILDDGLLGDGENTLELSLPHDTGAEYDLVHYDGYRVEYPRAFEARDGALSFTAAGEAFEVHGLRNQRVAVYRETDVDGERKVQRLRRRLTTQPGGFSAAFAGSDETATYYIVDIDAIHRPEIGITAADEDLSSDDAELLIVAHPDFVAPLDRFVDFKRSQGISVLVADVESVYSQFNHGIVDPVAIRAYVKHAVEAMNTKALLLVGGDTYDYHDYLGLGALSFVPTPYAATGQIVRFAPVDPLYGDLDDDGLPDLAVGRWPVRTTDELDAVIDKTLAYTGRGNRAVLAADAVDLMTGFSFAEASEALASELSGWAISRAYIDELGIEEARETVLEGMNSGASLASYFGHSGPTVWSFEGLFDTADAAALQNKDPMIVTQWGCWNSYYVAPEYDTLAHELLLGPADGPGVGAAAVLGAATLSGVKSEELLGARLFDELGTPGISLGEAIRRAKDDLAATDPHRLDVLLGWTLLGDPTLVFSQPE